MPGKLFAAALAAALLCTHAALSADAQDCSLKQIASLPITTTASGKIDVPVKIDGTDQKMQLSFTNETTILDQDFVDAQNLKTKDLPIRVIHGQSYVTGEATIAELQIGSSDIKAAPMTVVAPRHDPDQTAGTVGLAFLSLFDVEFDFKNAKLNLFSHASCPGREVYWATSYGTAPLVIERVTTGIDDSAVLAPMKLDGNSLNVEFVISDHSLMSIGEASTITGVSADALEGNAIDLHTLLDRVNRAARYYRYPFKGLSVGGVTLENPDIILYSRGACHAHTQWPPLLGEDMNCIANLSLSTPEWQKLHLYFAFGEGKLYVTAADAHK